MSDPLIKADLPLLLAPISPALSAFFDVLSDAQITPRFNKELQDACDTINPVHLRFALDAIYAQPPLASLTDPDQIKALKEAYTWSSHVLKILPVGHDFIGCDNDMLETTGWVAEDRHVEPLSRFNTDRKECHRYYMWRWCSLANSPHRAQADYLTLIGLLILSDGLAE
ncbi:hypothetical protein N7490_002514 [Penicillium lividum]|nr:hypothetical protein N7490_002514 [Penicillium lividum]